MIDRRLREVVGPSLDAAGRRLAGLGLRPGWITGLGWLLGAISCVAAGTHRWPIALVLWLANRLCDGLDGPIARATGPTERGGFIDVVADFSVYGGFVVGVALAVPSARLACCALLFAYYCSGTALLALSSLVERRGHVAGDGRSLHLTGGLAEGAETIAVYILFCLLPRHAAFIAWVFTGAVAVTAAQRIWMGWRLLAPDRPSDRPVPVSRRER